MKNGIVCKQQHQDASELRPVQEYISEIERTKSNLGMDHPAADEPGVQAYLRSIVIYQPNNCLCTFHTKRRQRLTTNSRYRDDVGKIGFKRRTRRKTASRTAAFNARRPISNSCGTHSEYGHISESRLQPESFENVPQHRDPPNVAT